MTYQHDAIAVVDFGGQYAHLIATKVRLQRVRADILQPEDPLETFQRYKGIILSGSPSLSSLGEDSAYNKQIYDLDLPILGFCFGHQEIAKHYGGTVRHGGRQWGPAQLQPTGDHPIFRGLDQREQVWMSHFDSVETLGSSFVELGYTLSDEGVQHRNAAIGSESLRRYGFQFHPEVDDTLHGEQMIGNFVRLICGCTPSWTMAQYLEQQSTQLKEQVGQGSVFLLISGGVDSTVAAKLFGTALGPERLHLLHIDNGLMRKDESRQVLEMLRGLGLGHNLHFVDASDHFLEALGDAVSPEQKRAIIGQTFIDVFEQESRRLGIESFLLGQGTIYPDTIETGGTKRANTIKTHHNRVPVIEQMIAEGRVVEPLAELYKTEVRELGERLDIPREALWRHPFPGPGLGVRLLCSRGRTDTAAETLDAEVTRLAAEFNLTSTVLPVQSVGVKADLRSYEHPVLLSGAGPWPHLLTAAGRILESVDGINRCVWNLGPKAPATISPLRATVTRERLDLLREADHLVMEGLSRHGVYDQIWQCPTVLLPLTMDGRGRELCVIRPIHSARAMTATAAKLPDALLTELRDQPDEV